jgi:general secretion pathway protein D
MKPPMRRIAAASILSAISLLARGQAPVPTPQPDPTAVSEAKPDSIPAPGGTKAVQAGAPVQADSLRSQRKAAKLYLQGVQLLEKNHAEEAWGLLKQAAELEPANGTYLQASELARQTAVSELVLRAGRERGSGDSEDAAKLLGHALEIDPGNPEALQRLRDLGDKLGSLNLGLTATDPISPEAGPNKAPVALADGPIKLEPKAEKLSFHLRTGSRQMVEQVFRAYGIEASVHESVQPKQLRLDLEDASFPQAMRVLGLLTHTFYEPLDPHRVVVAQDTRENRTQFQRLQMETIYLPGLNDKELTEVSNLARNVFEAQQAVAQPTKNTMTIRAPAKTLNAFNRTITRLVDGKSQVDLDVKVIQLAYGNSRHTGTTLFSQTTVANAYSEIQSILAQNAAAVQQIIESGVVPNAIGLQNQLTIIGILIASGEATVSGILAQGFVLFGGGIAESAIGPQPVTVHFDYDSSDTRLLDDVHLRLADQESGTFKTGERYPIQTSSYSSIAVSALATAGLTNQTIPQIQYEDIGLTLKATPSVMRSNDVALTLDLKIDALEGSSVNDIPVLDNRAVSGVLTLKAGETAVLISDLSRTEARALAGLPAVSDIPGLRDIGDNSRSNNVARLLILVTPTVVRDPQRAGPEPMLMVDKSATAH